MSRTKGALSRKTLAKQLGISLEEYLELEKNGKLEEYRSTHGIVDTVSSNISNEAEKERKENLKTELQAKKISKTGKTPSSSPEYKSSEKLTTSTKPNITKDTIIILPDSTPKSTQNSSQIKLKFEEQPDIKVSDNGDFEAVINANPTVEPSSRELSSEKRKLGIVKAKPNECFCSRCHKLILKDSSFRLILSNMIPGIASYHYNVDNKQILCYDCAHGLATIIEEYFENEDDLASEIEDEEIGDTNIKEMVKPVEDIKPSEDEDLIF